MWTWKSYFQFSLRELALVVAIAALALSWAIDHQRVQGQRRYTGNPLDLAIEGHGYFVLTDGETGETAYTRRGQFSVNACGQIVARFNHTEWSIQPAICIPSNATGISITSEGRVRYQQPGTTLLLEAGQMQLAVIADPTKLRRIAPSLYAQTDAAGELIVTNPGFQGSGQVWQGVVDESIAQKFSFSPWRW